MAQACDDHQDSACSSCACEHAHESTWPARSLAVAAVFTVAALACRWLRLGEAELPRWLSLVAIVLGGWFLLPGAWNALRRLRPNINLLMVVATVGAAAIGEWTEAATVVVLFGIAEWLEGWADRRARRAVAALLELAPDVARVRENDGVTESPVASVPVGAVVLVRNGERIPLDGVVLSGRSAVDQAPITGESVPVDKAAGDTVFAGSINGEGALELRVTKPASDTTLARIIRLVAEAQEQKAPAQRFVDVFAQYYTPAVAALALLIFLVPPLLFGSAWTPWLYRACVLLIIACPCALVISTPVSIVAGLTALARRGVLVKGGAHLETLGKLRALAFDKTGTLTEGKPQVLSVQAVAGTETEVLGAALAVDQHSSHPLAQAIVAFATARGLAPASATGFHTLPGRGAEAEAGACSLFVGNHRHAHELGLCTPAIENALSVIEAAGHTAVVVGEKPVGPRPGRIIGLIALGDRLRGNAREAVAALHRTGVDPLVVLSGDNARTVTAIAREAGIEEARGDLLPEEKVAAVQNLRREYSHVAMVGDGVNDAPAMAAASLGIAMGAGGTDAAIETADVALMTDDLEMIPQAVQLGRRTLGIIRFNIAFALGLKALFLGLAIGGISSLWLAILADTGATLLVVANALRLLRKPAAAGKNAHNP